MPTGAELMKRAFAFALLLAGACSQETAAPPANEAAPGNEAAAEAPLNPPTPGEPGGLPDDRTPIAEGPIDPKSAQGAGQVLQRYFALVEAGNSAEARRSLVGRRAKARPQSIQGSSCEHRRSRRAEGAAGSIYVDIPVQLYGRTNDGEGIQRSRQHDLTPGERRSRFHAQTARVAHLRQRIPTG